MNRVFDFSIQFFFVFKFIDALANFDVQIKQTTILGSSVFSKFSILKLIRNNLLAVLVRSSSNGDLILIESNHYLLLTA